MIVSKFGGSSVADAERLGGVADLLAERLPREADGRLVVVSAMGKTTKRLLAAGETAVAGDSAGARGLLDELAAEHRSALDAVCPDNGRELRAAVAAEIERAGGLLGDAAAASALSPALSDALLATGELLSSRLLAAALGQRGVDARWVDPRDLVATDEHFGEAVPDEAEIERRVAERVLPLVRRGTTVVTGGFVGRSAGGATTVLGWEGSDYSAALLGAAARADEIEIWTDVDGILTADPRQVSAARLIPAISYAEAAALAWFGAKVVHPATLAPAARAASPVRIRNRFRPEVEGTRVTGAGEVAPGVHGVACRGSLAIVGEGIAFAGTAGRAGSLRELAGRAVTAAAFSGGGPLPTAGTLVLPLPGEGEGARRLASLLERSPRLAAATLVGRELDADPELGPAACRALGALPHLRLPAGAVYLTFLVPEDDAGRAVAALHDGFFG